MENNQNRYIVYKKVGRKQELTIVWKMKEELISLIKDGIEELSNGEKTFNGNELICNVRSIWVKIFYLDHAKEMIGEYSKRNFLDNINDILIKHIKNGKIEKREIDPNNRYITDREIKINNKIVTMRIAFHITSNKNQTQNKIRIITMYRKRNKIKK